jgi:hypothetical protein
VRDGEGNIQISPPGIAKSFTRFFQEKYAKIGVDLENVQKLAAHIQTDGSQATGMDYEAPFTLSEIYNAIHSGGHNRAPGRDGLGLGFYKATWEVIREDLGSILNEMFFEGTITAQQKQGIIVCLPKTKTMLTPGDRRPITLLNTDYKLVTRMIVQRLRPIIEKYLSKTQYCGVPGNTILVAVATVRDTIAYAEHTNTLMCVLALDFQQAFDNISHDYLFTILRSYGLTSRFVNVIRNLCSEATSAVQVNGRLHGPIPIRSGVRQGCPLSMAL